MAKGIALRCHVASPSLGHYAALSFIIIGRDQGSGAAGRRGETEKRRRRVEDRGQVSVFTCQEVKGKSEKGVGGRRVTDKGWKMTGRISIKILLKY
jgi:hypothetical protein